jgi:hypothetical protein
VGLALADKLPDKGEALPSRSFWAVTGGPAVKRQREGSGRPALSALRNPTGGSARLTTSDWAIIGGLVLAGVALPVALAMTTHAISVPRDDDWAYRRVLFDFALSGHYSLVGWGTMTLVGQILWALPFVLVLGAHQWVPPAAVKLLGSARQSNGLIRSRSRPFSRSTSTDAFPGQVLCGPPVGDVELGTEAWARLKVRV